MGGDLIPLPTIRIRKYQIEGFKGMWEKPGYEIPVQVKVSGQWVLICKMSLSLLASLIMLVYLFYVGKGYLSDANIEGFSRVTLQHPTDSCNPLKANCKAKLSSFSSLPYCNGSDNTVRHQGAFGTKSLGCKYLDTFDLFQFNSALSEVLIPTRYSTFYQKENEECAGRDQGCSRPYRVLNESHNFVADIEDFTLLIDHGFQCPTLGLKDASWRMLGFYREADPGCTLDSGFWTELKNYIQPSRGRCLTDRKYIPCDKRNDRCVYKQKEKDVAKSRFLEGSLLKRLLANYGVSEDGSGDMDNTPYGDVVNVSTLMKIAGIDLSGRNHAGLPRREEGEVIVIDIHYSNYIHYSFPNSLPTTYEYRVTSMPSDSFKITHIENLGGGVRKVMDVHGIQVLTRTSGKLGRFSIKSCLLSTIELSIALAFVNWILRCYIINTKDGDLIVKKTEKSFDADDVDMAIKAKYGAGMVVRGAGEGERLIESRS